MSVSFLVILIMFLLYIILVQLSIAQDLDHYITCCMSSARFWMPCSKYPSPKLASIIECHAGHLLAKPWQKKRRKKRLPASIFNKEILRNDHFFLMALHLVKYELIPATFFLIGACHRHHSCHVERYNNIDTVNAFEL